MYGDQTAHGTDHTIFVRDRWKQKKQTLLQHSCQWDVTTVAKAFEIVWKITSKRNKKMILAMPPPFNVTEWQKSGERPASCKPSPGKGFPPREGGEFCSIYGWTYYTPGSVDPLIENRRFPQYKGNIAVFVIAVLIVASTTLIMVLNVLLLLALYATKIQESHDFSTPTSIACYLHLRAATLLTIGTIPIIYLAEERKYI